MKFSVFHKGQPNIWIYSELAKIRSMLPNFSTCLFESCCELLVKSFGGTSVFSLFSVQNSSISLMKAWPKRWHALSDIPSTYDNSVRMLVGLFNKIKLSDTELILNYGKNLSPLTPKSSLAALLIIYTDSDTKNVFKR